MVRQLLQCGLDRFSDRKAGHLDRPSARLISRNTTRGIKMKRIPLTQGKSVIVDDRDFEWLNKHKWSVGKYGNRFYAVRSKMKSKGVFRTEFMHRLITAATPLRQVDHINHIGLDNRRCNLRLCTMEQNRHNAVPHKSAISKHKGVVFHRPSRKWVARIYHRGIRTHLGCFESEKGAAIAYNKAAKKCFGKFAYVNKLKGDS